MKWSCFKSCQLNNTDRFNNCVNMLGCLTLKWCNYSYIKPRKMINIPIEALNNSLFYNINFF